FAGAGRLSCWCGCAARSVNCNAALRLGRVGDPHYRSRRRIATRDHAAVPISGGGSPAPAGCVVEEFGVQETGLRNSSYGADKFGFEDLSAAHWNLTAPALYEHAIRAREASIVQGGALCAETGSHTG